MARIITFSQRYPGYHPRAGHPTQFVEKFENAIYPNEKNNFHTFEKRIYELNPHLGHMTGANFVPNSSLRNFIHGYHAYETKIKNHTIRAGERFKEGDMFSPRVWGTDVNPKSGRSGPYHSKTIILAPDQCVERVYPITMYQRGTSLLIDSGIGRDNPITPSGNAFLSSPMVAGNDGLLLDDFIAWFILSPSFKKTKRFQGQIICWKDPKY